VSFLLSIDIHSLSQFGCLLSHFCYARHDHYVVVFLWFTCLNFHDPFMGSFSCPLSNEYSDYTVCFLLVCIGVAVLLTCVTGASSEVIMYMYMVQSHIKDQNIMYYSKIQHDRNILYHKY
jgi:hypothetical protein